MQHLRHEAIVLFLIVRLDRAQANRAMEYLGLESGDETDRAGL